MGKLRKNEYLATLLFHHLQEFVQKDHFSAGFDQPLKKRLVIKNWLLFELLCHLLYHERMIAALSELHFEIVDSGLGARGVVRPPGQYFLIFFIEGDINFFLEGGHFNVDDCLLEWWY